MTQPKSKGHPGTAWFNENSELPCEKSALKSGRELAFYGILRSKAILWTGYKQHVIKKGENRPAKSPCLEGTHQKK